MVSGNRVIPCELEVPAIASNLTELETGQTVAMDKTPLVTSDVSVAFLAFQRLNLHLEVHRIE